MDEKYVIQLPSPMHPTPQSEEVATPVKKAKDQKPNGKGTPLTMDPPEPWPHPVDGIELMDDLVVIIRRYVAMQPGCAEAVALWVLHCHAFEAATISPRLAIISPEKQCGKTTLLSVINGLVPKPLHCSNITAAAIFRTVEMAQPTLLIDEADTFIGKSDEIRGVLNSGHNKASAFVVRSVGDQHEPRKFTTWAPTAIAAIGGIPDTLQDRSIVIEMRRRLPDERVARFRADRIDELIVLAQKAARWVENKIVTLQNTDPGLPDFLHDRAADNWRPLVAIADTIGGEWPERIRGAIVKLAPSADDVNERTVGPMLLRDIREILEGRDHANISTDVLIGKLIGPDFDDRPWGTWRKGFAMNGRSLAKILRPYKIHSKSIRTSSNATAKGFAKDQFEDAFRRYIPCKR